MNISARLPIEAFQISGEHNMKSVMIRRVLQDTRANAASTDDPKDQKEAPGKLAHFFQCGMRPSLSLSALCHSVLIWHVRFVREGMPLSAIRSHIVPTISIGSSSVTHYFQLHICYLHTAELLLMPSQNLERPRSFSKQRASVGMQTVTTSIYSTQ